MLTDLSRLPFARTINIIIFTFIRSISSNSFYAEMLALRNTRLSLADLLTDTEKLNSADALWEKLRIHAGTWAAGGVSSRRLLMLFRRLATVF